MIVDHPAKFHNEKIPKKYHTVSKTVRTGMVRHLKILLVCSGCMNSAQTGELIVVYVDVEGVGDEVLALPVSVRYVHVQCAGRGCCTCLRGRRV